jgi:hypothetical protein
VFTIPARDIHSRVRQRLTGLSVNASRVIWQSGAHAVLIHAERTQAKLLDGWLVVGLLLETEQTGLRSLEIVYFLGAAKNADGTSAAARINAADREAAMLAEIWGDDLQRVVWDAVLDAVQIALQTAKRKHQPQPLTLRGFTASPDGIDVSLIVGAI